MHNTSRRIISITSSAFLVVSLAACGSPPMNSQAPAQSQQNTYPASSYPAQNQQSNYVEYGHVSNVEVIQTEQKGTGSGIGAVIGGVVGAVAGHQVGGGTGKDLATVAGAVGGAYAGNAIEKNSKTTVSESFRVSIRLDNGTYRSYDVPSYGELRVGDRVKIQNNQLFRIL